MRLVQILGDDVEELYSVGKDITDEDIVAMWEEYQRTPLMDSFDEFIEEEYPSLEMERVFVDEIYV